MKKYQIQNSIGTGNFSTVFKGILLPQSIPCAIKVVSKHTNIAAWQASLLRKFKHPNIISIIDFEERHNQSRLILEYVGINTLQLYEAHRGGLKEHQVKCILFQVALGLTCIHAHRIIHRDIKPENILIDKKQAIVKIIDFGLSIEETRVSTDYIATRWYRAPQNLLKTKEYSCAIDVFSLACVVVELLTGNPLFPGENNVDQIYRIFNMLGSPTLERWPRGFEKMQSLGIRVNLQNKVRGGIRSVVRNCDPRLIQMLERMLELNPKNRISCSQILRNDYFRDIRGIVPPIVFKRYEDDILRANSNKSLNFKGFQPAKSSKNNSKQKISVQQKINFHHVSAKNKQIQFPPAYNHNQPLIRQQKSSSVDSRQVIMQSLNNQTLLNSSKAVDPSPPVIMRKLSTPSLLPSFPINQNVITRNSTQSLTSQNRINLSYNQSRIVDNFKTNSEGTYVQLLPEDNQTQMKIKMPVADSSETTSNSKLSDRNINNFNKLSARNSEQYVMPFYPEAKQMQLKIQLQNINMVNSQNNNNIGTRMASLQNSIRELNNQSFHSLINGMKQQTKYQMKLNQPVLQIQAAPMASQLYNNSFNSSNNSINNVNFMGMKRVQINPNYDITNRNGIANKQVSKRIRNFPQGRNNIPNILFRDNHSPSIPKQMRMDGTQRIQQQVYKSPPNHQFYLSPSPRLVVGSPENYLNENRQRRLQPVNSGITPFFSPPQRKF